MHQLQKTKDLAADLAKHAPEGIDFYFDNVGGDHLEAALDVMKDFGCCVECLRSANGTSAGSIQ